MKFIRLIIPIFLFIFFLQGCGYTTRSTLPANLQTIYIEHFGNKIDYTTESGRNLYLPLLEVNVRDAVIKRFQYDGSLRVSREEDADLILKGNLKSYQRDVLRYTDNEDAEEYRIRIVMSLQLWNTEKQSVMWTEPDFAGEATYFVSGPLATSEDSAVEEAMTDLARRIVERTIEDW